MDNSPQETRFIPRRVPLVFSTEKPVTPQKQEKFKKSRQNSIKKASEKKREARKKQEISNQFLSVGQVTQSGKLTVRQSLFVRYLVEDPKFSATAAAEKVGYANPAAVGSNLLKHPIVSAEIKRLLKITSRHLEISAEKTLSEIANIAYSNVYDYLSVNPDGSWTFDLKNINRNQASAIQEIVTEEEILREPVTIDGVKRYTKVRRTKFKLHDKLSALNTLTKFQQLMPKEEPESTTNVTINVLDAIINGTIGSMNVQQLTEGSDHPARKLPNGFGAQAQAARRAIVNGSNGNPQTIEGSLP
jgi:phage terminase small subunit